MFTWTSWHAIRPRSCLGLTYWDRRTCLWPHYSFKVFRQRMLLSASLLRVVLEVILPDPTKPGRYCDSKQSLGAVILPTVSKVASTSRLKTSTTSMSPRFTDVERSVDIRLVGHTTFKCNNAWDVVMCRVLLRDNKEVAAWGSLSLKYNHNCEHVHFFIISAYSTCK